MRDAVLALERRPVDEILAVLERVADRWLDHRDPLRREAEARLAESTGLAPAMLRWGLDETMHRVKSIGELLDQDLGTRAALDGFVKRAPGLRSRAYGPGRLVAVFAGNVPGLPAFDMALALALKSGCLARPPAAEPHFAGLFARSVAEADAGLGACLEVRRWGPDDAAPYAGAGAVLVYGSDASVSAVRRLLPPGVRFIGHGHKLSFAVVAREAATVETARLLAWDVAMYDQQGCVSPHLAYVERGGPLSPAAFAAACGAALADLQAAMPRAALTPADAMSLRAARDEAEFAADCLHASMGDLAWAVAHYESPSFLPSPLNRLLRTYAVDDLAAIPELVGQAGPHLQTVAVAAPPERRIAVAVGFGRLGASRICPVGRAQQPDPRWRHDGRPTAGDLVRWVDIEEA